MDDQLHAALNERVRRRLENSPPLVAPNWWKDEPPWTLPEAIQIAAMADLTRKRVPSLYAASRAAQGACSSVVEHGAHNPRVAGSNPAGPTWCASVAFNRFLFVTSGMSV